MYVSNKLKSKCKLFAEISAAVWSFREEFEQTTSISRRAPFLRADFIILILIFNKTVRNI